MLETAFFFQTLVIADSNDKSPCRHLPAQSGVQKVEIMVISKHSLKRRGRIPAELPPNLGYPIKAYSGTLCKLGSVRDRTQLFQFQTATLPVVVVYIIVYLFHQFIYRQFTCVIETLRLQHRKEAFHRRIVPAVRLSRHALNHGMLGKQFPISRRTVQHALVGMQHRSFAGQTGYGFFKHFLHHFAVDSTAHGVGDDFPVEQVQYRR